MSPLESQPNCGPVEYTLESFGLSTADTLAGRLEKCLIPNPCLLGLGNWDWGDDAAGLSVARKLIEKGYSRAYLCESSSTRWMQIASSDRFEQVLLIDAVEAGLAPGSVICLEGAEIQSRFPQISTHKFSLGLMARWMHLRGVARVLLLGIQASQLREAAPVSPPVQAAVDCLAEILVRLLLSCFPAAPPGETRQDPHGEPKPFSEPERGIYSAGSAEVQTTLEISDASAARDILRNEFRAPARAPQPALDGGASMIRTAPSIPDGARAARSQANNPMPSSPAVPPTSS